MLFTEKAIRQSKLGLLKTITDTETCAEDSGNVEVLQEKMEHKMEQMMCARDAKMYASIEQMMSARIEQMMRARDAKMD